MYKTGKKRKSYFFSNPAQETFFSVPPAEALSSLLGDLSISYKTLLSSCPIIVPSSQDMTKTSLLDNSGTTRGNTTARPCKEGYRRGYRVGGEVRRGWAVIGAEWTRTTR